MDLGLTGKVALITGGSERHAATRGLSLEQHYQELGQSVPLGRVGEAEQVARLSAFLASDAPSYVTGTAIDVDGGSTGAV